MAYETNIRIKIGRAFSHLELAMEHLSAVWKASNDKDVYIAAAKEKEARGEPAPVYDNSPTYTAELNAAMLALDGVHELILALVAEWWGWNRDNLLKRGQH